MSHKNAKISQKNIKTKEKDWRMTKQRIEIFDYVRKNDTHPRAEDIYNGVKKKLKNISVGTVYRNLQFLRDHGYLKEFAVDRVSHFEARVDSHVHFVCDMCHGIEDIDGAKDVELIREFQQVADKNSFYIRSENYEIRGICKHCKKESHPKKMTPELFCIACSNILDDFKKESPVCKECKFSVECAYVK